MVEIPTTGKSQFKNNYVAIYWGAAIEVTTNVTEKERE